MDLQAITRTPQEHEHLRQEAEQRWEQLGREQPELAETIAFGRGLVGLYIDDLPAAARVNLSPEAAREKLTAGQALLEGEEVDLDLPGIRHFFFRLCSWAGQQPDLAPGGDRLQRALMTEELSISDLLASALAGDSAELDALAARLGVETVMVQTLTGFTVSAALMGTARVLAPLVTQEGISWDRPLCPICGGQPLFAESDAEDSTRLLRCAACAASWHFPVERCVHCGNEDRQTLRYIVVTKGTAGQRVELCDICHGYLKTAFSHATPPELLTIQDAALLHLDAVAQEQGYT